MARRLAGESKFTPDYDTETGEVVETEVESEERDESEYETWPMLEAAAKLLGVKARTVHRMVIRGELSRYKVSGKWRYDPEELQILSKRQTSEEPVADETDSLAGVLEASTRLLTQAHGFIGQLMRLSVDPTSNLMKSWEAQTCKLQERTATLEDKNLEMLRLREEMISEQHLRDLDSYKEAQSEERKMAAFRTLKDDVLPLVKAKFLEKSPDVEKALAAVELLRSIDPALIQTILTDDPDNPFTPEQRAKLKTIIE